MLYSTAGIRDEFLMKRQALFGWEETGSSFPTLERLYFKAHKAPFWIKDPSARRLDLDSST
jgi:hypothetical protein